MLGWSIRIKRGDKSVRGDKTILYAETTDLSLDSEIRKRAEEVLDSNDYPEWGYGYPNRYLIRNDQLPPIKLYRYVHIRHSSPARYSRETFVLGEIIGIPGNEVLWVELWDQS